LLGCQKKKDDDGPLLQFHGGLLLSKFSDLCFCSGRTRRNLLCSTEVA
jgi:hypothetical protein